MENNEIIEKILEEKTKTTTEGEFIQINSSNNKTIKKNSLFHLVEVLVNEKHSLIAPYDLLNIQNSIRTETRNAYFFRLAITHYTLYADYRLIDRHLTVDALYSDKKSKERKGLTAAHYTEKHKNVKDGSLIVVHVYFTSDGKYYIQQRKKIKENTEGGIESLDPLLEQKLEKNISEAKMLFKSLQQEKAERYGQAVFSANEYERQLSECSIDFTLLKNREQYQEIAPKFLEKIKEINFYNDFAQDSRDTIVLSIVKQLRNFKELQPRIVIQTHKSKKSSKGGNKAKESLIELKMVSEKEIPHQKDNLWIEISNLWDLLQAQLKQKDITSQIEAFKISNKLKEKLLEHFFLNSSHRTENFNKKIKEMETTITQIHSPNQLFLNSMRLDDGIERCKKLLPYLKSTDKFLLLKEIFSKCFFENLEKNVSKKLITIINVLFDESNLTEKYNDSYKQNAILVAERLFAFNAKENFKYSFLFKTFYLNELELFEMLLQHGYDPNSPGFIINNLSLSMLTTLIYFGEGISDAEKYVDLLLKYGAYIDQQRFSDVFSIEMDMSSSGKLTFRPQLLNSPKTKKLPSFDREEILKDLKYCPSNLWLACYLDRNTIVPYLIEKTDLFGISCALAHLARLRGYQITTFLHTPDQGVYLYKSKEDLDNSTITSRRLFEGLKEKFELLTQQGQPQINIFLADSASPYTKKFDIVTAVWKSFKIKCAMNPEEIEETIKKLEKEGEKDKMREFIYVAQQFLLIEKTKRLNFDSTQKLMRLDCERGIMHFRKQEFSNAMVYFSKALQYPGNVFREKDEENIKNCLEKTEIYQYAMNQEKRCRKEISTTSSFPILQKRK